MTGIVLTTFVSIVVIVVVIVFTCCFVCCRRCSSPAFYDFYLAELAEL